MKSAISLPTLFSYGDPAYVALLRASRKFRRISEIPEHHLCLLAWNMDLADCKNLSSIDFLSPPITFRLVPVVLQKRQVGTGPACV
jgi:hypothetical protein